jgi:hypothetical protein
MKQTREPQTVTVELDVLVENDIEGQLEIKITDEGVICDVICDGEIIKTWGMTAQEIADNLCW